MITAVNALIDWAKAHDIDIENSEAYYLDIYSPLDNTCFVYDYYLIEEAEHHPVLGLTDTEFTARLYLDIAESLMRIKYPDDGINRKTGYGIVEDINHRFFHLLARTLAAKAYDIKPDMIYNGVFFPNKTPRKKEVTTTNVYETQNELDALVKNLIPINTQLKALE